MAKTRKKYVPKQIRIPSLITQLHSFHGFESALQKVIETGVVELDVFNMPVYHDNAGKRLSFACTLGVYIDIIDLHAKRNKLEVDLTTLLALQEKLKTMTVLDEEEIELAQKGLSICKLVLSTIKPSSLFDIIQTLRTRTAISLVPDKQQTPEEVT